MAKTRPAWMAPSGKPWVRGAAGVPFREALDQAMAGNMLDMITIAMLLRAYHMAREGELPAQLTRSMLG